MQQFDSLKINKAFYEACAAATTVESVRDSWICFFKQYGGSMFACHLTPPIGAFGYKPNIIICAYGFPDKWHEFYKTGGYDDDDPVIRLAQLNGSPMWKSDLMDHVWDSAHGRQYSEFSRELNLQDFLAIPVYGPCGYNGCFTIGFKALPDVPRGKLARLLANACQTAHLRHIELKRQTMPQGIKLSPREKDVLKLISLGKNDSCISESLGITKNTASTYIRTTYLKLNVNDRVTASLRAMSLGLV